MHVPLSLKMSATWENEKLSSSIVPRICNLSITQVIFNHLLEDMTDGNQYSFFVSVRMRDNTRRVLRSPELNYPSNLTDVVYLDFSCSIQYSHALKRDSCNYLQLLIQRRKKYKKKTVNLGYKTLAYCTIDLAQVLQKKIENKFLELYDNAKSMANIIGRVEVKHLNTLPLGKDLVLDRRKDNFEEEEDGMHDQFSEPDDSDRIEDSDYEQNCGDFGESSSRQKKIMKAMSIGQKQIKQKIMGLLKKVKLMEHSEELDPHDTRQLWDEIERLDNVSEDSDIVDIDTNSIQSTPRPTLRPFFGHSGLSSHPGICNSDDSNLADSGAKLLKKLHLETNMTNANTFCNSNITDILTSANEKGKNNEGSETTEDEVKSISTTKKSTCTQDKDSNIQLSAKNKSKALKPSLSNIQNNPIKKESQKPKKQMSAIMKTFSFTTTTTTVPTTLLTSVNSPKLVLVDSISPSSVNDSINSSETLSPTTGSTFMTPSPIMTPISLESAKENINSERKISSEINSQSIRQRSSSTPHYPRKDMPRKHYDPDTDFSSMKVIKYWVDDKLLWEPRYELVEQVNRYLHNEQDGMDIIYIINLSDYGGKYVSEMFHKEQVNHIAVTSFADTKFAMTQILNRIRKKSDSKSRICLLGSDCHLNNILRVFVDQINLNYSKEMVNYFRFFLIPITGFSLSGPQSPSNQVISSGYTLYNNMARRLCSVDSKYASLFSEFIQVENVTSSDSLVERDNKFLFGVHDYLQAEGTIHSPIGDCLVASSVKPQNTSQDCDSSAESFIPFLCEVRLGEVFDVCVNRNDGSLDDQILSTTSSSPPRSPIIGNIDYNAKIYQTTPSSGTSNTFNIAIAPNSQTVTGSSLPNYSSSFNISPPIDVTSLDLQLEYWTDHSSKKVTLKSAFRQVLVNPTAITSSGSNTQHSLSLTIISKEKKQKIIRIAKKPKHEAGDCKKETFDDIIRILCTSKSQNALIKVTIDGVMWTGVKFFQLNPYWRTQIKTFPIATFLDN